MAVAQLLQSCNFRITQSGYYQDNETGKYREIDIIATKEIVIERDNISVFVDIGCNIECKSTKEKPWIIFKSKAVSLRQVRIAEEVWITIDAKWGERREREGAKVRRSERAQRANRGKFLRRR